MHSRGFQNHPGHVDGLVQERRNSIANALELHLSCTNPWMCWLDLSNIINLCSEMSQPHLEGILPKGPYLPCVSMACRALLVGYHRSEELRYFFVHNGPGFVFLWYQLTLDPFLPEASFGLRVFSLPARVCVHVSINHEFVRTITHHPFKLGSPNLDQRCKKPWLRALLFCGMIDHDLQGQIEPQS